MRLLKTILKFVCLLFALGLATAMRADNVGVNFTGGFFPTPLGSSETAGVVTQAFWNNVGNGSASGMSLQGDGGGGSMATYYSGFTLTAGSSGSDVTSITDTGGNSRLMIGYALSEVPGGTGSVSVAVSGVPVQFTNSGYAVIVYFDYGNGGAYAVDKVTLNATHFGTRTIYGQDKPNTDFSGTFKQVPSTSTSDLGASTPDGNYMVFSGLTDTSFTLTASGGSNGGLSGYVGFINGFQIVPAASVPSTAAPVITSPNNATDAVDVAFSYSITANNNPTGFGASGLPPGLGINPATGVISGTPNLPGTYDVVLGATNSTGVGTLNLTLSIGTGLQTNAPASGTTNGLDGGALLDIDHGLICGGGGTLLSTTNGGGTWGLVPVNLTNDLMAVQGIGGYEFIGGSFGLIALSPDGGQNWTMFNLGVTNTFYSFGFLTPFWGYAAGSGGLIYFWNGSQWLLQNTGAAVTFYGIDVVDNTTAYVVGGGGTIFRFDGSNWVPQSSGLSSSITLYGVSFCNPNFGYAVGSGGTICRTTDGGTSWQILNSGTTATLRSIYAVDINTAWAVGDGGVFLQTTDGGGHWTAISLGTTVNLFSITFLNGRGLICGGGGVVFLFEQAAYALNDSPVVSIVTPTNSAAIWICSKTPITAQAGDGDGYVSKLELFFGTNEVAQSGSSTLKYVFTNDTSLGTFRCTAKATDNLGASAFSAPVTFTVGLPGTNNLVTLGLVPTNAYEFCVCGLTGRVYAVQTSTNLLQPWQAWRTVTNQAGFVPVVDGGISAGGHKFYRAGLATDLGLPSVNAAILDNNTPSPGATITASVTITNGSCSGISVPAGKFHVGFYWSTNSSFAGLAPFYEQPVSGCDANGTNAFNSSFVVGSGVAPGTYYLGFYVNDENEVPECDRSNNGFFYWKLTVQ